MAYQRIKNVKISGFAACVPPKIEENKDLPLFKTEEDFNRFVATTGVYRRRIVSGDSVCTSDLCYLSGERLLNDLKWDRSEVECIVFVSQTPDYIYPATACILQDRLGLSNDCMALDVSLGCTGWVYGLSTIASIISAGKLKKGLLLVGDTSSRNKSKLDKSTYPLFGDAGVVTALEFDEHCSDMLFDLHTDGKRHKAIIIPDGGYRNPFSEESLLMREYDGGNKRTNLDSSLDGSSVFTFGISKAPQSMKSLIEHFEIDKDSINYWILHQANLIMTQKIQKKMDIPDEKTPYIIQDFGNTSSSSISLNIATSLKNVKIESPLKLVACAFGVGLSWGSVYFELDKNVVFSDLIEKE